MMNNSNTGYLNQSINTSLGSINQNDLQPVSHTDPLNNDKYNVLRAMYEKRLRSVAETINRSLLNTSTSNTTQPSVPYHGNPALAKTPVRSSTVTATNNSPSHIYPTSSSSSSTSTFSTTSGGTQNNNVNQLAYILDTALTNEKEQEILRLQEDLATKDTELSRLQVAYSRLQQQIQANSASSDQLMLLQQEYDKLVLATERERYEHAKALQQAQSIVATANAAKDHARSLADHRQAHTNDLLAARQTAEAAVAALQLQLAEVSTRYHRAQTLADATTTELTRTKHTLEETMKEYTSTKEREHNGTLRIQNLEQELTSLRNQLTDSRNEAAHANRLTNRVNELEVTLTTTRNNTEQWYNKATIATHQAASAQQRITVLTKKLEDLTIQENIQKERYTTNEALLHTKLTALEEKNTTLSTTVRTNEQIIQQLRKELTDQSNATANAVKDAQEYANHISKLINDQQTLTKTKEYLETNQTKFMREIQELYVRINNYQGELKQEQFQKEQLQRTVEQHNQTISSLQKDLWQMDREKQTLQQDNDDTKAVLQQCQTTYTSVVNQANQTEQRLQATIHQCKQDILASENRIMVLESELATKDDDVRNLKNDLSLKTQTIVTHESTISGLQARITAAQNEIDRMHQQEQQYIRTIQEYSERIGTLVAFETRYKFEIQQHQNDITKLQQQINQMETVYTELRSKYDNAKKTMDDDMVTISALRDRLSQARETEYSLRSLIETEKNRNQQYEEQFHGNRKDYENLIQERNNLAENFQTLQNQYDTTLKNYNEARTTIDNLQYRLQDLTHEINDHKQSVKDQTERVTNIENVLNDERTSAANALHEARIASERAVASAIQSRDTTAAALRAERDRIERMDAEYRRQTKQMEVLHEEALKEVEAAQSHAAAAINTLNTERTNHTTAMNAVAAQIAAATAMATSARAQRDRAIQAANTAAKGAIISERRLEQLIALLGQALYVSIPQSTIYTLLESGRTAAAAALKEVSLIRNDVASLASVNALLTNNSASSSTTESGRTDDDGGTTTSTRIPLPSLSTSLPLLQAIQTNNGTNNSGLPTVPSPLQRLVAPSLLSPLKSRTTTTTGSIVDDVPSTPERTATSATFTTDTPSLTALSSLQTPSRLALYPPPSPSPPSSPATASVLLQSSATYSKALNTLAGALATLASDAKEAVTLRTELHRSQQQASQLEQRAQELTEAVEEQRNATNKALRTSAGSTALTEALQEELAEVGQQLQEAQQRIAELAAAAEAAQLTANESSTALQDQLTRIIQEKEETVQSYETKLTILQNELLSLQHEYEGYKIVTAAKETSVQQQLQDKDERIQSLQDQLNEQTNQLETLEDQYTQKEMSYQQLVTNHSTTITSYDTQIQNLNGSLTEANKTIESMEQRLADIVVERNKLVNNTTTDLTKQTEALQLSLKVGEELREEVERLQRTIETNDVTYRSNLAVLQSRIDEQTVTNDKAAKKVQVLRNELLRLAKEADGRVNEEIQKQTTILASKERYKAALVIAKRRILEEESKCLELATALELTTTALKIGESRGHLITWYGKHTGKEKDSSTTDAAVSTASSSSVNDEGKGMEDDEIMQLRKILQGSLDTKTSTGETLLTTETTHRLHDLADRLTDYIHSRRSSLASSTSHHSHSGQSSSSHRSRRSSIDDNIVTDTKNTTMIETVVTERQRKTTKPNVFETKVRSTKGLLSSTSTTPTMTPTHLSDNEEDDDADHHSNGKNNDKYRSTVVSSLEKVHHSTNSTTNVRRSSISSTGSITKRKDIIIRNDHILHDTIQPNTALPALSSSNASATSTMTTTITTVPSNESNSTSSGTNQPMLGFRHHQPAINKSESTIPPTITVTPPSVPVSSTTATVTNANSSTPAQGGKKGKNKVKSKHNTATVASSTVTNEETNPTVEPSSSTSSSSSTTAETVALPRSRSNSLSSPVSVPTLPATNEDTILPDRTIGSPSVPPPLPPLPSSALAATTETTSASSSSSS